MSTSEEFINSLQQRRDAKIPSLVNHKTSTPDDMMHAGEPGQKRPEQAISANGSIEQLERELEFSRNMDILSRSPITAKWLMELQDSQ